MPNETNTPQDHTTVEAARAAKRLFTPDRILAGALVTGALGFAGYAVGQDVTNNNNELKAASSASALYEHNQTIIDEINGFATVESVNPASVVAVFGISKGKTLYSVAIETAEALPKYQDGDQKTKDWIDFTIGKSAVAQGSYDVGDTYVISEVKIDNKDTFVVENGAIYPFPAGGSTTDPQTIPSPETH